MYAQTVRAGAGESYFKSANGAGELFLDHRPRFPIFLPRDRCFCLRRPEMYDS